MAVAVAVRIVEEVHVRVGAGTRARDWIVDRRAALDLVGGQRTPSDYGPHSPTDMDPGDP